MKKILPIALVVVSVGAVAGIGYTRTGAPEYIQSAESRVGSYLTSDYGRVACIREGANKQVISSQADSLIKISRIWADFFPANTSNQPI